MTPRVIKHHAFQLLCKLRVSLCHPRATGSFLTSETNHSEVKPAEQGKGCEDCVPFFPSGVPHGVVNVVFGTGAKAGEALVCHPDVPLISFTGSTLTAQRITEKSAPHCKRLSLELGGKNPAIIFDDADLTQCIPVTLRSSFANQVPPASVAYKPCLQQEVCLCLRVCVRARMCTYLWIQILNCQGLF